jgi:hypothetical protein
VAKTAKPVIVGKVPNFLRRWVKLHKAIVDCTAAKNELTPRVKQFLAKNKMPGFILANISPSIKVDAKVARAWAKANLSREEYLSLFVRAFDVDAFVVLIREKQDKDKEFKEAFPEGIIIDVKGRTDLRPNKKVFDLYLEGETHGHD